MRRVVITGLGVVSAAGTGTAPFFDNLLAGRSGVRQVEWVHPSGPDTHVIAPVADFEPEAHFTRPQHKNMDRTALLAIVAAREALDQAGLRATDAPVDRQRFGLAIGTGMGGANTLETAYSEMFERKVLRVRPMTVVLAMNNGIVAQMSLAFGLRGPSNTFSSACASSAAAIGEAMRLIRHGYADAMLAGGTEALLTCGVLRAWQSLQTLAKPHPAGVETSCRPFSADRTGLVLGEGAGMLVLEEMESARRRGAPILAELAGFGATTDAHHLTQPSAEGQVRAIREALADAGMAPADIGYVNAHGTATDAGDVVETDALRTVFGPAGTAPPISSTKALHGHALGAAGAIEMVAAVEAMRRGVLPPTAFLDTPDPRCDLDYVPHAPREAPGLSAVMSSSFAFGGTNAVLIARRTDA